MDLNVCSRRVHDGYATIRSRGRSRPRAVYRSDSEELLKEAGGPYALPRLSNFPIASSDLHQLPRWSDLSKDCLLIENYGTLRDAKKTNLLGAQKPVTLNTFSKVDQGRGSLPSDCVQQLNASSNRNGVDERKHGFSAQNGHGEDCVYDTVPIEECHQNDRTALHSFRSRNSVSEGNDPLDNSPQLAGNFPDAVGLDSSSRKVKGMENLVDNSDRVEKIERRSFSVSKDDTKVRKVVVVGGKRINSTKDRQPIYAVPNILSRPRRDRRIVVADGNYVPSGDLYRTTAKYIEDINRNIAEIDKSYEELKSNSKNSAYGVINKIAKGELVDRACNLYGYARKRDMAPMLPISSDFGENLDESSQNENTEIARSFSVSRHRPNSFGKLPPKLLPRSSSIENTSRHSTGSTTTSSTKSTESLYAISESLSSEVHRNAESKVSLLSNVSKNSLSSKQDRTSTEGSDDVESKDELSSTDEDRPTAFRSADRLPVTSSIRKNRSRVDAADRSCLKKDRVSPASRYESTRQPNGVTDKRNAGNLQLVARSPEHSYLKRRYDTLPYRKSRVSSRPLHKSSEDVLDGDRPIRDRSSTLNRPCTSNIDVSVGDDESLDSHGNLKNFLGSSSVLPVHMMDATDVILRGQLDRTSRSFHRQEHFPRTCYGRTRHNSLESEPEDKGGDDNCRYGGFATLPRRRNLSKDQTANDPLRRLSGNVPILEPLYEHAVSDPVKPRSTENIIPWWELATRKYRHRSCPSLQVTQRGTLFGAVDRGENVKAPSRSGVESVGGWE